MTEQHKIILCKVGKNKDIIKIQFLESLNKRIQHNYLAAAFSKCFKNHFYKIILDMTNLEDISYPFIATLIEATSKVRSKDGDVKIINLSDMAKQSISTFNSYTYLSIAEKKEK